MQKVGIIGAGAWGTALASLMARRGHETWLWALEPECAASINDHHVNHLYLPDVVLPNTLRATHDLADLQRCEIILLVVPAQHMRATLQAFMSYSHDNQVMVLCSKGIEIGSLSFMHTVLRQTLPQARMAVLSGPSFAIDVAQGLPTAVTLACEDSVLCAQLADWIRTPTFRPYLSADIIGAEIGGAVKNVLAIACGMVLGLGLGRSAHAALIARGFSEMSHLGAAMGAQAETLTGLCGLGDLVLTCSSEQSRNMSCGFALGQGADLTDYLAGRNSIAEGVTSAPALQILSQKYKVSMPISNSVAEIISGRTTAQAELSALFSRPVKAEIS